MEPDIIEPDIIIDDDHIWWALEEIRGYKVDLQDDGFPVLYFRIKWVGTEETSWEPYTSLNEESKRIAHLFLNSYRLCSNPP